MGQEADVNKCGVCGRTDRKIHEALESEGQINHQFDVEGTLRPTVRQVVMQDAPHPFAQRAQDPLGLHADPVLRQALIDKGVLEPQDLINATLKIQAVSAKPGGVYGFGQGSSSQ